MKNMEEVIKKNDLNEKEAIFWLNEREEFFKMYKENNLKEKVEDLKSERKKDNLTKGRNK